MRKSYEQHQNRTKKSAAGSHHRFFHGGVTAQAEELPVYSFDEVVVTATRTENDVKKVPASTQVITQEDIKRGGATSVRNALSMYANIFQKSKVRGGGHDIIIRGMETKHSLVMVNGRRISNEADASGLGNAMSLDRININDVEKIEIVRGPSSALYGSEAMGGVLNIITKPSKEQTLLTGLEHTSEDTSHWWHADTGRIGNFSMTLDARFNKINRSMLDTATESDPYGTAQTYNASLNYYVNDHSYVNAYMDYYSQHLKTDTGTPTMKPITLTTSRGMSLSGQAMLEGTGSKAYKQKNYGISWNGKTDKNDWQIQAYMSKFNWSTTSNTKVLGSIPPAGMEGMFNFLLQNQKNAYDFNHDEHNMWAIEGRDSLRVNDHHRVTFGAEYVKDKVAGTGLGKNGDGVHSITENGTTKSSSEKTLSSYAAYLQDEIEYGKWFIVPAIRYDHHSAYGSHTSPKIGVTYNATDHFRIKANYGDGFKAPSVSQIYRDLAMQMGRNWVHLTGNLNLKPEKSKSWDLGVEAEFGKGYGSLTYFDNDVNNLIESIYKGKDGRYDLYRYENVNKARIKGLENTLGYRFNDTLEFKVTSTLLDAKDTSAGKDLTQRARLSQIYQLIYDDHKDTGWSAVLWNQLDYKFVTGKAWEGGESVKKSYSLTNFSLTRKVNKDTRVYGSVQNIFDKKDEDCDLDGRFWSIGWEYKF
ncbi:MAG: TonB-dependent receptor [Dialister sp.]|nr:TonB-dependent receptor [Dialister sp.]